MSIVNAALRQIFDVILWPFAGLPWWVGVGVLGMLMSVAMLWTWKKTSNQDGIDRAKSKIHAGLFEIRLFNDDIGAIFKAQGAILKSNLKYFGLSMVPLVWIIVPMVLMIGQLNHHYGYRGFAPGDETLVKVELAEDWRSNFADVDEDGRPPASLEAPDGVEVISPMTWFPSRNMLVWNVVVHEPGRYDLTVNLGDQAFTKSLDASDKVTRRSPVRHSGGWEDSIFLPAEAPLPKGAPVSRIELDYADTGITGDISNRVWVMFLVSIVFAFAIKDRMGVKI